MTTSVSARAGTYEPHRSSAGAPCRRRKLRRSPVRFVAGAKCRPPAGPEVPPGSRDCRAHTACLPSPGSDTPAVGGQPSLADRPALPTKPRGSSHRRADASVVARRGRAGLACRPGRVCRPLCGSGAVYRVPRFALSFVGPATGARPPLRVDTGATASAPDHGTRKKSSVRVPVQAPNWMVSWVSTPSAVKPKIS